MNKERSLAISKIVDCVYQQIFIDRRGIDNERFYLGVKKDDKYGIIDSAGKVVMEFLSLPNDVNILPYTLGDGYVGVEKHTVFGRYKVTDVFFMDVSNCAKLNLKGQCLNLEIKQLYLDLKTEGQKLFIFLLREKEKAFFVVIQLICKGES